MAGKRDFLLQGLFNLHDFDRKGLLEEEHLIKMNEKIAMLHYGKDTDRSAVRAKYSSLFRRHLDPEGQPVPYTTFRHYMQHVLNMVDPDELTQEMILEQLINEANAARALFHCDSFSSTSDLQIRKKIAKRAVFGGA